MKKNIGKISIALALLLLENSLLKTAEIAVPKQNTSLISEIINPNRVIPLETERPSLIKDTPTIASTISKKAIT